VIQGVLLAAGAGRRMGRPKALVRDEDGTPWLTRSVGVLVEAGCDPVVVVLGAEAETAADLLRSAWPTVDVVVAEDWAEGMGASLRTGLEWSRRTTADAALVHLVDLPDVGADVVARVGAAAAGPSTLARAAYDGEPGHPVLIGRDHWQPVVESLRGDAGARAYLAEHRTAYVECGDLATGRDVDRPTGNQHRPT
jgi:CTP:molybdopterin cytidylyltransferase MocA